VAVPRRGTVFKSGRVPAGRPLRGKLLTQNGRSADHHKVRGGNAPPTEQQPACIAGAIPIARPNNPASAPTNRWGIRRESDHAEDRRLNDHREMPGRTLHPGAPITTPAARPNSRANALTTEIHPCTTQHLRKHGQLLHMLGHVGVSEIDPADQTRRLKADDLPTRRSRRSIPLSTATSPLIAASERSAARSTDTHHTARILPARNGRSSAASRQHVCGEKTKHELKPSAHRQTKSQTAAGSASPTASRGALPR